MKRITAEIFPIGDELLSGEVIDANGPFLAERLTQQGCHVQRICVLPDEMDTIAESVKEALKKHGLVVLCGGLGPTSDDRTTEAVANALGRPLVMDRHAWERVRQIFLHARGQEPPPGNEKQTLFPEGADILQNQLGTAPGYALKTGQGLLAVLPGPPKENRPMFDAEFLPWLDRQVPERMRWEVRIFRVFGLAESEVGHRLRPLESRFVDLVFGYRFSFPEILVKIRGDAGNADRVESASKEVHRLLAPHVYNTGPERLPAVLGRALADRGLRVVTAESCTGGLAAKFLTDEAGSSAWMERGFVAYSNESKEELLGVKHGMIEEHGAVSEPVAHAMLAGALERSRADVGFSITGIAGPSGGTPDKPIGTVCIAWGDRREKEAKTYRFVWDRDFTRTISAWAAMRHLLLFVTESRV